MSSRYKQQALADAQAHAFDPYHLRPLASLNRRRLIALPGLDEEAVGKSGAELLSKIALVRLIRPHVRALQLEGTPDGDLPQQLNAVLAGQDGPRRALAEAIAEQQGRLVGYLIASILLSPRGLTDPMVAWEKAFLKQWREGAQEIEFVHDCDVAACALAGRPNAAVLMLGSALRVGFVPPAEGYRRLAERFTLE